MTGTSRWGRRTTIRLFPDYGDSVIWFLGPVPYEQTRLTDELVAALKGWDSFFYASLDLETRGFTSEQLASTFAAEGQRLASLLSLQVGPEFEIEYGTLAGTATTRTLNPASNPEAQAFFNDLADAELAQLQRLEEHRGQSGPFRLVRKSADGSGREIIPSADETPWTVDVTPRHTDG